MMTEIKLSSRIGCAMAVHRYGYYYYYYYYYWCSAKLITGSLFLLSLRPYIKLLESVWGGFCQGNYDSAQAECGWTMILILFFVLMHIHFRPLPVRLFKSDLACENLN